MIVDNKKVIKNILCMMLEDEEFWSILIEYKKFPLLTEMIIGDNGDYYKIDRMINYTKLEGDLDIESGVDPELLDKIASYCQKSLITGYEVNPGETKHLLTKIKGAISYIRSKTPGECTFLVTVSDADGKNRRIVNTKDPDTAIELILSVNGDTKFDELNILHGNIWKVK